MRCLLGITIAVCAAIILASTAYAQQPMAPAAAPASPPPPPAYGPPITVDQAKKAVAAAVAEGKSTPYLYTFAVVDPTGSLVYFEKDDGAIYAATEIAIGKARTAAIFKRPSKAFFDQMNSGQPYVATLIPGLVAAAGGIPLVVDGKIVGAIGVSGGPNGLIDSQAAQAGADALK
jgi:glc operon protein GlcG